MELANPSLEIKPEIFKNIFLEDWNKLRSEAETIYNEALALRKQGKYVEYMAKMRRYNVYIASADTMLEIAAKFPIAEA